MATFSSDDFGVEPCPTVERLLGLKKLNLSPLTLLFTGDFTMNPFVAASVLPCNWISRFPT